MRADSIRAQRNTFVVRGLSLHAQLSAVQKRLWEVPARRCRRAPARVTSKVHNRVRISHATSQLAAIALYPDRLHCDSSLKEYGTYTTYTAPKTTSIRTNTPMGVQASHGTASLWRHQTQTHRPITHTPVQPTCGMRNATNVSTATRTMAFQAHVRLPCARQVGHAAPAACAHCACEQGHPSGECVRT